MKTTYTLERVDSITTVTVEPLMNDVLDALNKMKQIKDDMLDDTDKQQLRLKIIGLEAIYTFLGGLVTEQNLVELRKKYGVETNDNTNIIH
jgi:hypothetical protein